MKHFVAGLGAALLMAAPQLRAVQYFQYDKADAIVDSSTLGNPLFYDGSVVATDGKTFFTWLEFHPSKRDAVWFGARDSSGKWVEKEAITGQLADCANPTLTRDKSGNIWITYESAVDGKWGVFATFRNEDGVIAKPVRVSKPDTTSVNHRVTAAADGGIWIAWQADNHGQFDIFARELKKLENSSNADAIQSAIRRAAIGTRALLRVQMAMFSSRGIRMTALLTTSTHANCIMRPGARS